MKRRDFLKALVGGTVAAVIGGAPRALAGEVGPTWPVRVVARDKGLFGIDWGDRRSVSVMSRVRTVVNLDGSKLLLFDGVIDVKEVNVYESLDRGESWVLSESVPVEIEEVL